MADKDIGVTISAQIAGFKQSLQEASSLTQEFSRKISDLGKVALEFAGITLGIEGLKKFVESLGAAGLEVERVQAQIGLSAEKIGLLKGIAQLTGTSLEAMVLSMEKLSLSVQKSTKEAFSPQAQAMKVLGLNAKDLIGIPADQYFAKIADAVAKLEPGLNRTNALQALGLRNVAELLPALDKGSAGWARYEVEIRKTGAALTEGQAKGFAEIHESVDLLTMSLTGVKNAMGEELQSTIQAITKQMTEFLQAVRDSIKEGGAWNKVFSALGILLRGIAAAFAAISATVQFLNATMTAFWETTAENGEEVAKKLRATLDKIKDDFKGTLSDLGITEPATISVPGHGSGERKPVGGIGFDGKQAAEIAKLILERRRVTADAELQIEDEKGKHLVALGLKTEEGYLATHVAMLQKKAQIDEIAFAKERDAFPRHSVEWEKAENKRVQASATANMQILQASEKLDLEQKKIYLDLAKSINTSLESSLSNVIQMLGDKTKTIGDIMKGLLTSLQKAFSDFAAKGLMNALLGNMTGGSGVGGTAGGIGGAISSLFAGFKAGGGPVPPGRWAIAGENGPEIVAGGSAGASVLPSGAFGGGDTNFNISVNAPGATMGPAQYEMMTKLGMAEVMKKMPQMLAGFQNRYAT